MSEEQEQQNKKIEQMQFESGFAAEVILDQSDIAEKNLELHNFYTIFVSNQYCSINFGRLHKYYKNFVAKDFTKKDIWIDWKGIPVPWNIPFNVFFDTIIKSSEYPLKFTMHYTGFPKERLLKQYDDVSQNNDENEMYQQERDIWMNDLKQASCIKFQNSGNNILSQLEVQKKKVMWINYIQNQYAAYYQTFKEYYVDLNRVYQLPKGIIHRIPLRIYVNNLEKKIQISEDINDVDYNLKRMLIKHLPNMFDLQNNLITQNDKYKNLQIVSKSCEINLNTPILWLHKHFCYPDGFIYISITFDIL